MRRIAYLALAFGSLVPFLASAPAHAQATRTWVSGVGDDANPCSRTAPCKTFAGSISKTAAGGEINCLDPGGFGALTITKSITISCDAGTAGVLVSGTNGFIVNAAATDIVVVDGVDFDGVSTGLSGINILSAGTVHIRRSVIRNFRGGGSGITVVANSISTRLQVSDSFISNNGNSAFTGGIVIKPAGSGSVAAVITNTRVDSNTAGIRADGTTTSGAVKTSIGGSSISNNTSDGITAIANSPGGSLVVMSKSVVSNNAGTGLVANNAIFQFGDSIVTGNLTGVNSLNGAFLQTYQNNMLHGNGNDNVGVLQTLTVQ